MGCEGNTNMKPRVSKTIAVGAVATAAMVAGANLNVSAVDAAVTPAATPPWTSVSPSGVGGEITAFAAAQAGNANYQWAFQSTANEVSNGYPSAYSRVNDGSWTKTALPGSSAGEVFVSASAISPTDVLAFTDLPGAPVGAREWQYNGTSWKVIRQFDAPIGTATVINANDVWVFGKTNADRPLGVYHYDGKTWTKLASTLNGGQGLSGATPQAWAYSLNQVAHYNGKKWVPTVLPIPGNDTSVTDFWDANGTYYAVGANKQDQTIIFISGNGITWSIAATYDGATPVENQIANDGQNGIWLAVKLGSGGSAVLHYILSIRELTETPLPGTVEAIHQLDITHELAGGYDVANAGPSTSAEIEYYN
jgi:hypothetical protein